MAFSFNNTLFFRLSLCLVLASFEFLACLTPKLLREQSAYLYNTFRSFTTGLIIAQSLAGIVSDGGFQKEEDPRVSFILFSVVFVALMAADNYVKLSKFNPYNALRNSAGDDEDLGIELSSNFRSVDIEDTSDNDSQSVEEIDEPKAIGMNAQFWLYSCLIAMSSVEMLKGVLIGSEEHEDMKIIQYIIVEGIFISFVFGILTEEALSDPQIYIRFILMLISSMPLGIFIGLSLPINDDIINFTVPKLYSLCAGAIASVAIGHMLNEDVNAIERSSLQSEQSSYVHKIQSKVAAFVIGYIFSTVILLSA
jgi:hypothetical protein